MKEYTFDIPVTGYIRVSIYADNEEDAIEELYNKENEFKDEELIDLEYDIDEKELWDVKEDVKCLID